MHGNNEYSLIQHAITLNIVCLLNALSIIKKPKYCCIILIFPVLVYCFKFLLYIYLQYILHIYYFSLFMNSETTNSKGQSSSLCQFTRVHLQCIYIYIYIYIYVCTSLVLLKLRLYTKWQYRKIIDFIPCQHELKYNVHFFTFFCQHVRLGLNWWVAVFFCWSKRYISVTAWR